MTRLAFISFLFLGFVCLTIRTVAANDKWKNSPAEIDGLMEVLRKQKPGATEGAMVLPSLKLVVCSYPKGASTTAKWIMMRLLGQLTPKEICRPQVGADCWDCLPG